MIHLYEVDKNNKYYKIIQTDSKYRNGRNFTIGEVSIADKKVNLSATDKSQIGGFCISTYDFIFRWLIRGDTLCEVKIPKDTKIYKTESENGIYVADKIILTNPIKIDDTLATKLYYESNLPEISYFKALAACSIKGYINTVMKVCNEKVNKQNVNIALQEFEEFCKRREEEFNIDTFKMESVQLLINKLKNIRGE